MGAWIIILYAWRQGNSIIIQSINKIESLIHSNFIATNIRLWNILNFSSLVTLLSLRTRWMSHKTGNWLLLMTFWKKKWLNFNYPLQFHNNFRLGGRVYCKLSVSRYAMLSDSQFCSIKKETHDASHNNEDKILKFRFCRSVLEWIVTGALVRRADIPKS